jgi:hypothetical protein
MPSLVGEEPINLRASVAANLPPVSSSASWLICAKVVGLSWVLSKRVIACVSVSPKAFQVSDDLSLSNRGVDSGASRLCLLARLRSGATIARRAQSWSCLHARIVHSHRGCDCLGKSGMVLAARRVRRGNFQTALQAQHSDAHGTVAAWERQRACLLGICQGRFHSRIWSCKRISFLMSNTFCFLNSG